MTELMNLTKEDREFVERMDSGERFYENEEKELALYSDTEIGRLILILTRLDTELTVANNRIENLHAYGRNSEKEKQALTAKLEKVGKLGRQIVEILNNPAKYGTGTSAKALVEAIDNLAEALKESCPKCGGSHSITESCSGPHKPPRHPKDNPKG